MSKFNVKSICRIAIMAALYLPLARMAVEIGTIKISLGSLPVVVMALLCGPVESALVALIGEFLKQMLAYGFTATTLMWLIPPALRGVVIGLVAMRLLRTERPLEKRPVACYATCIVAAMVTTLTNIVPIWADSVIYGYYSFAYVFGSTAQRLITGIIIAVLVATVSMPLVTLLRRQGLAPRQA